jgi:DNA repair protein RadA/Sms
MATATYSCTACGHAAPRWFGRCPECRAWSSARAGADSDAALDVVTLEARTPPSRWPTGSPELDRVLGGGLVPGSVILLAGEPGIGKSTLVLQLVEGLVACGARSLLATSEESLDQVGLRAARLGIAHSHVRAAASSSLQAVLAAAERDRIDVLLVDSIQAFMDARLDHAPGSVTQVRACASALVAFAKATGAVVVLVGHVTKDGGVAGPKTLEHIVDVVLSLDGERSGSMRLLRCLKNRFGPCDETGVFIMNSAGLEDVADPSALLLADRRPAVPGSVVFAGLEGSRPVLVEIQALVSDSKLPQPRRVALGVDARRLAMLTGVLAERAGLQLGSQDVFVSAVGGLAVREPAGDLALCLALFSAATSLPVDAGVVVVGEVGLGGEIRRIPGLDRRVSEAARLGFRTALVPRAGDPESNGARVVAVGDLTEAFAIVRAAANGSPREHDA